MLQEGSTEWFEIVTTSGSRLKISQFLHTIDDNGKWRFPRQLQGRIFIDLGVKGIEIVGLNRDYENNLQIIYSDDRGEFYEWKFNEMGTARLTEKPKYLGYIVDPSNADRIISEGPVGDAIANEPPDAKNRVGAQVAIERVKEAKEARFRRTDIQQYLSIVTEDMSVVLYAQTKDGNVVRTNWVIPTMDKYWRNTLRPLSVAVDARRVGFGKVVGDFSKDEIFLVDDKGNLSRASDNKVLLSLGPLGICNRLSGHQ